MDNRSSERLTCALSSGELKHFKIPLSKALSFIHTHNQIIDTTKEKLCMPIFCTSVNFVFPLAFPNSDKFLVKGVPFLPGKF